MLWKKNLLKNLFLPRYAGQTPRVNEEISFEMPRINFTLQEMEFFFANSLACKPPKIISKFRFAASVSLLLSCALHSALFLAIILHFNTLSPPVHIGNPENKFISSYLYKNAPTLQPVLERRSVMVPSMSKSTAEANKVMQNKAPIVKPLSKQAAATAMATAVENKQSAQQSSRAQGEKTTVLLGLLHAAIQEQQHYPPSALQMGREGRIAVNFILSPDGSINNLHILKSCGMQSLDEAALAAVRNAAPFQQVEKYLTSPQLFTINVVFEINANFE